MCLNLGVNFEVGGIMIIYCCNKVTDKAENVKRLSKNLILGRCKDEVDKRGYAAFFFFNRSEGVY